MDLTVLSGRLRHHRCARAAQMGHGGIGLPLGSALCAPATRPCGLPWWPYDFGLVGEASVGGKRRRFVLGSLPRVPVQVAGPAASPSSSALNPAPSWFP